jgi:hypothetical protein
MTIRVTCPPQASHRALERILRSVGDREHARALVTGFWS